MKFVSKTGLGYNRFHFLPFRCYEGTFIQTVTLILVNNFCLKIVFRPLCLRVSNHHISVTHHKPSDFGRAKRHQGMSCSLNGPWDFGVSPKWTEFLAV